MNNAEQAAIYASAIERMYPRFGLHDFAKGVLGMLSYDTVETRDASGAVTRAKITVADHASNLYWIELPVSALNVLSYQLRDMYNAVAQQLDLASAANAIPPGRQFTDAQVIALAAAWGVSAR